MKSLIGTFLLLVAGLAATGQVQLQLQVPPAGMVSKEALWNLTLVCQGDMSEGATVRLSLQEAGSGQVLLSGVSRNVFLRKGAQLLSVRDLGPVTYNFGMGDFARSWLPLGNYNACYQVFRNGVKGEELVGEDCFRVTVEPLSPPQLLFPADGAQVEGTPTFTWTAPAPLTLFNNLAYDLLLVELLPGQTAAEAVQLNLPVYSRNDLARTSESYPGSGLRLDTSKVYAWQVMAKNGESFAAKTEAWTFRIRGNPAPGAAPLLEGYVLLSPDLKGMYTIAGRKLQVKVISYSPEYTATFVYADEQDHVVETVRQTLRTGDNFIDLKVPGRVHSGRLYKLTLIDANNQRSQLRFLLQ